MNARRIRSALGWILALGVLGVLAVPIARNFSVVRVTLKGPDVSLVLLGSLILAAYFILRATLWLVITRSFSVTVEWKVAVRIWFLTEFSRYLPGNVWSFLGRAGAYRLEGVRTAETAVVLLREALTMVASAAVLLPMLGSSDSLLGSLSNLAGVVGGLVLLVLLLPIRFRSIPPPSIALRILSIVLAVAAWLAFGFGSAIVLRAFHVALAMRELTFVSIAAWLLGYISLITPSGLGVREAAIQSYLVRVANMPSAVAAALALTSRIVLTLTEVTLVLLVLLFLPRSRAEQAD